MPMKADWQPLPTNGQLLPTLLKPKRVSEITGITVETLASQRFRGEGLPFVKIGRVVRYRSDDVMKFINANTFTSTTEAKASR